MALSVDQKRIKQIRQQLGFTQSEFGKILDLPSTADIEYGKKRITGKIVMRLLQKYQINPLWLYNESQNQYLNPYKANVIPKAITVNQNGHENILLVNAKAAAGYGKNIGDHEFIQQLPAFNFPLPEFRNSSFRGFQIVGDSMMPLVKPGDWVLAKAVNSFKEIHKNKIYVVVQKESIRLKYIAKDAQPNSVTLLSSNPEYMPVKIALDSILELWEYHSKISFGIEKIQGLTLEKVYQEVKDIKNQIKKL